MNQIRFNVRGEIVVPFFRVGVSADTFDLEAILQAAKPKKGRK